MPRERGHFSSEPRWKRQATGSADRRAISTLLVMSLAMACSSMGPKTIPTDQFDYGSAIASSANEQLLLNMVRLRYDDPPVFLSVSSVISQYQREGSVSLLGGLNTGFAGDNTAALGGSARWADRPTITYTPVKGREFARNLLTPITIEALFGLLQAGWSADLVIRIAVLSINGIQNEFTRPARRSEAAPEFWELIEIWDRLRTAEALDLREEKKEDGPTQVFLFFRTRAQSGQVRADQDRLRTLLGLDPAANQARLTFGLLADDPGEVAVLTRSILDIMRSFAWRFEVPPEHVDEGRTATTFSVGADASRSPMRVGVSPERPDNAYVAVKNRDHWFFIDDRDRDSKRSFSFLSLLLNLVETEQRGRGPLVTISN